MGCTILPCNGELCVAAIVALVPDINGSRRRGRPSCFSTLAPWHLSQQHVLAHADVGCRGWHPSATGGASQRRSPFARYNRR